MEGLKKRDCAGSRATQADSSRPHCPISAPLHNARGGRRSWVRVTLSLPTRPPARCGRRRNPCLKARAGTALRLAQSPGSKKRYCAGSRATQAGSSRPHAPIPALIHNARGGRPSWVRVTLSLPTRPPARCGRRRKPCLKARAGTALRLAESPGLKERDCAGSRATQAGSSRPYGPISALVQNARGGRRSWVRVTLSLPTRPPARCGRRRKPCIKARAGTALRLAESPGLKERDCAGSRATQAGSSRPHCPISAPLHNARGGRRSWVRGSIEPEDALS
jgi:hypothetical protein